MENKVKVWLARDEGGYAFVHFEKPYKSTGKGLGEWVSHGSNAFSKEFPSVKWEDDEPTEAYITLAEPQEQTKQPQSKQEQTIDWEQRRYEIAKEMLPVLYQQSAEILKCGQSITWEETAVCALVLADTLIAKLKEQSE